MWLPPTDNIDAQLDAALTYKNGEAVYELSAAEREAIHELYGAYDELLGEPDAALTPIQLELCKDALHDAYGEVQIGGRLEKLREDLLSASISPTEGGGRHRSHVSDRRVGRAF